MNKGMKCSNCYFYDICDDRHMCGGYSPITDEAIDQEVDNIIESGRYRFYEEWYEYMAEYEDDFF